MADLTEEQIVAAARNDYGGKSFVLGDRTFPVKDLDYDSYIEFIRTAKPIIVAVAGAIEVAPKPTGEVDIQFNPAGLDYDAILKLAEKELPHMVLLCCRLSDPTITIREIKKLAPRPQLLLQAVLRQIKHNDLIKEFASFFPQLMQALNDLAPEMKGAIQPVPQETLTSMTEGTPSSS